MRHGAGGRAMRTLIEQVFAQGSDNGSGPGDPAGWIGLSHLDDGAAIPLGDGYLVITTDSHVIHPLEFPGGDIGRLAVSGTVNDLAMMGATEVLGLTSSFIVEEGFSLARLEAVQGSIRRTCVEAGTRVLTGDTKVMGRGEIDGLVINTAGVALCSRVVGDAGLEPGNLLLVTGSLGDHGLAVMAVRHQLELAGELTSDVAPVNELIRRALAIGGEAVTAMKDPTRGGLASALHEMASKSGVGVVLDEAALPVSDAVRSAGELLGIDPLHVANEGKAVMGVRSGAAPGVLAALREHPLGRRAAVVGRCVEERPGQVILDTGFGRRLVTEPEGEPLPRIC
jgi:hydrogenase expression/formation protein HypE